MSRGAALAYPAQYELDYWDEETGVPVLGNTELYRLLGHDDFDNLVYGYVTPQQSGIAATAMPYASSSTAWQEYERTSFDPYSEAVGAIARAPRLARRTIQRMGVALVGLTVIVVALMALMALMVATTTLHKGAAGLSLSGYRDMQVGAVQAVAVDGAAIVDATSGGSEPAPGPAQAQPASQAPAASAYALMGPPTISVAQIEQVLASYGSPAQGLGQKLYDLGVKYGINPAFGLAFFVHESGCGTKGVARSTKSLGNIRWTAGYDNYQGYRSYSSWEAGMEDWYSLIKDQYIATWGLTTVDAIIPVYAPSADHNDPANYIAAVKQSVDSWRGK